MSEGEQGGQAGRRVLGRKIDGAQVVQYLNPLPFHQSWDLVLITQNYLKLILHFLQYGKQEGGERRREGGWFATVHIIRRHVL